MGKGGGAQGCPREFRKVVLACLLALSRWSFAFPAPIHCNYSRAPLAACPSRSLRALDAQRFSCRSAAHSLARFFALALLNAEIVTWKICQAGTFLLAQFVCTVYMRFCTYWRVWSPASAPPTEAPHDTQRFSTDRRDNPPTAIVRNPRAGRTALSHGRS